MEHASHTSSTTFNVNLQLEATPGAGEPVGLSVVVTEQRVGEPLTDFELLHDRLMHLIIVDASLTDFAHVHPILDDGVFRINHTFRQPGSYKLWAEAKPHGAADPVLCAFRVAVGRGIVPVSETQSTRYRVSLDESEPFNAHHPVELTFRIEDSSGQSVTDLEPLMAAGGHCVVISADLRDFLHVHPIDDVTSVWRGGPEVRFLTTFPRAGSYRAWGQFQHKGQVITAGFTLEVR